MKNFTDLIVGSIWILVWVSGIVFAKGFWSTFFAVTTGGIWSLYLLLEKIYMMLGVV